MHQPHRAPPAPLPQVPTTVAKAKQGKMKYIIGSGENLMDWTYAGNVAQVRWRADWVGLRV